MADALPRGSIIGMLGGGQLGRMTAHAAQRLGYRMHVFCDDEHDPAAQVTSLATIAKFGDEEALARFADAVDVVTLEFENVPTAAVAFLRGRGVTVRPGERVLATCQDRALEKAFIEQAGLEPAPWREVRSRAGLDGALAELGGPCILKRARFGYDGHGQVRVAQGDDLDAAWAAMGGDRGVLEGVVDFTRELSVIVGRGWSGEVVTLPPVQNEHEHHVLARTTYPAPITDAVATRATNAAVRLAHELELVGVFGVELFELADGGVLVNEIAPRPHNSGHWSLDACVVSQFELQVRAVAGLPMHDPVPLCPAVMHNLLGEAVHDAPEWAADPRARLHLYGKEEVRPGRKMGHVTVLGVMGSEWGATMY